MARTGSISIHLCIIVYYQQVLIYDYIQPLSRPCRRMASNFIFGLSHSIYIIVDQLGTFIQTFVAGSFRGWIVSGSSLASSPC